MQVTELIVKRRENYETDAGQLKGLVTLSGEEGKQTLVLSNGSLASIFTIIKEDVMNKVKTAAKAAGPAIQNASDEFLLIDAASTKVNDGLPF